MLPKKQYSSWPELLKAAYAYGCDNMQPDHLRKALDLLEDDLESSFLRGIEPPAVRPSGNLNCSGRTLLVAEGAVEPEPSLPRVLFASGHFHHNLLYAALMSALPIEAFHITVEEEVSLAGLDWWPHDHPNFKQHGHIDLQLQCLEDGWLPDSAEDRVLVDVKTKHSLGMTQLPDYLDYDLQTDGYFEQLAIYSELKDYKEVYLLYVNREVPSLKARAPRITARRVHQADLRDAQEAVKRRVLNASSAFPKFEPEMHDRQQEGGNLYKSIKWDPCGYCPALDVCKARRDLG